MSSGFFSQNGRSVAFLEIQGNPKRRRGSDSEYKDPTTTAEHDYEPIFSIQPPRPSTYGVIVGSSITLTPVEGHFTTGIPQVYRSQAIAYVPKSTTNPVTSNKKKK